MGQALAEGGAIACNEPGQIEAIQYPPGLAAVAAANQWILGWGDAEVVSHRLRMAFLVLFLVYIVAVYLLS